jgi:F420-non-reducing hydrogenase small subunit
MQKKKIKLVSYWAATCGGCDVATLDIEEKILDVIEIAEIVFWPVAIDIKYKDLENMDSKSIDICLFNGAIRNSEHVEMAEILREKSKIMVALGSCACYGGVAGLANTLTRDEIFNEVYRDAPSTVNPYLIKPATKYELPDGVLTLPEFQDTVRTLHQVIEVDYWVPGCPPPKDRVLELVQTIVEYVKTGKLPAEKVFAFDKALCDECPRQREEKKRLVRIDRPHQVKKIEDKCLLDQNLLCLGPATRGGCGARCVKVNMPCRGCMGPIAGVSDQGAVITSMIASIFNLEGEEGERDLEDMVESIKDPLGTFYRFTLPSSLLNMSRAILFSTQSFQENLIEKTVKDKSDG